MQLYCHNGSKSRAELMFMWSQQASSHCRLTFKLIHGSILQSLSIFFLMVICVPLTVQRRYSHGRHWPSGTACHKGLPYRRLGLDVAHSPLPTQSVEVGKQRKVDHWERHISVMKKRGNYGVMICNRAASQPNVLITADWQRCTQCLLCNRLVKALMVELQLSGRRCVLWKAQV